MTRFTALASVAVLALALATGSTSAFTKLDGLSETLNGGGGGGIDEPGMPYSPQINDHIVNGPNIPINTDVLGGPNIEINPIVLGGDKGKGRIDVRNGQLVLAFACKVGAEDILTLRNAGATVPAGTKVRWDVASYGDHGVVRLKSDLATGDAVRVATHADLVAGAPCIARAI